MDTKSPGDFIKEELASREWSQTDLAIILKKPLPTVNRILLGKHAILPEMAIALGDAFGNGAEIWMQREAAYRLSLAAPADDEVRRRARLFELAPIKEMAKRGWISTTDETDRLEKELCKFFGVSSLDADPSIGAVTRRPQGEEPMTPSQRAWCFRVRQLAAAQSVPGYDPERLQECKRALRKIAAYPQETHKVPGVLSSFGIRFVIVEPLSGTRVDGVAMWLYGSSPAIGLSCRLDRFDSFWFTLGHEITHVENRDEATLDSDLSAETLSDDIESLQSVKPEMERKADAGAAAMLIPPAEIESFIKRVGPLYSKVKINQFANRIKIHPAIVVGQLQHRGEIGYHANREMLSKVKHYILPTAITDGWGNTIDPRSLA